MWHLACIYMQWWNFVTAWYNREILRKKISSLITKNTDMQAFVVNIFRFRWSTAVTTSRHCECRDSSSEILSKLFVVMMFSKKQLKSSKSNLFYDSYPLSTSLPWHIGKAGSPPPSTNPHPTTSFCKGLILGPVPFWPTYYVPELYRSPVWCMILLG